MTLPATLPDDAPHLLVVDDDRRIRDLLSRFLAGEGYRVSTAETAADARAKLNGLSFDLLILDVMLPKMSGLELIKAVRAKQRTTPTLILTAKTTTEDKVAGLDSGADDYLTKPFAFEELLARVRSLLRRGAQEKSTMLKVSNLELDTVTHKAKRSGKTIELTAKEYSLLEYFMRNRDRVLSRTIISEHIWDYNFDTGTNIIDVYVNHLRNKVDDGFEPKLIHTVRGVGYVMKEG